MKFPRPRHQASNRRAFLSFRNQQIRDSGVWSRNLLRAGRPAMACLFEVIFPARQRFRISAVQAALDEVDRLEEQMTVYRPTSEISLLNGKAAQGPRKVEPRLLGLLSLACRISQETGGAFDITSGSLSKCWGFSNREGRLPGQAELDEALSRVGYRHLQIDPEACTVYFRRQLELNLGAIGKGYALDRAAEILRKGGLTDCVLHGGNSSILALGDSPVLPGSGWPVAIADPIKNGQLGSFHLRDLALSTSGAALQNFQTGGRRFGHIIDPRTGSPAETHLSATALASSAAVADALSTAFFMMPLTQVAEYCGLNPEVGAVIVPAPNPGEEPNIHRFGIAEQLYWNT